MQRPAGAGRAPGTARRPGIKVGALKVDGNLAR